MQLIVGRLNFSKLWMISRFFSSLVYLLLLEERVLFWLVVVIMILSPDGERFPTVSESLAAAAAARIQQHQNAVLFCGRAQKQSCH